MLVGKKKVPFVVSAVVEPLDFNSHLKTEIWLSNHQLLTNEHAWSSAAFYNYVVLKKQNSEKDLHAALALLFKNHVYPESGKPMGFKTLEEYAKNDIRIKFYVHKLTDIYLKSKLNFEISPGGNESYIYIFGAVSAFILLLAAINFINLSTARATRRAKEVGIRKTLGSHRLRLIGQFLFESVTTCLLSMMVSILLAELFLRAFEYITGSILLDTIWRSPSTVGIFFAFSLVVGLLSGLYPAFYLTSFIPVKVLKGEISTGARSFRNSLVVFQFTISILLITCALMVQSQLHFMANKELGFDQKNVLTIDHADLLKTSAETFKNELSKEPGVTVSSFHVGEPGSQRIMSFYVFQSKQMEHPASILTYFGDDKYISLHGMHLVKGRDFNKDLASDSAGIIFNEAAIRELGITGDPVGVTLSEGQKIIGVVQDFHWESMRKAIAPIAIIMNNKKHAELGFKIANTAIPDFIQKAEKKWKELVPDEPFQYHFLDSNFGEFIKKEEVFGRAINIFTILSIFISCIGLYGLSAYTIEQRTKEIGIRKVLGASALSIVTMLNKKFTLLVVIAIIISIPLSIYCIKLWLQEFAYKTEMGSGVFVVTVVLSILMAILTVSYHALKASLVNPSETLKYD
jgi:putative ABC transport system permease protein